MKPKPKSLEKRVASLERKLNRHLSKFDEHALEQLDSRIFILTEMKRTLEFLCNIFDTVDSLAAALQSPAPEGAPQEHENISPLIDKLVRDGNRLIDQEYDEMIDEYLKRKKAREKRAASKRRKKPPEQK